MEQLETGDRVDRYVVQRVLGAGGTAVVYLVQHKTLETHHALKVLSISSESIRKRLVTEGRVQAMLEHPNIVSVSDVIKVGRDYPGLLMEYVEGPSLESVLRRYKYTQADAEVLFEGILSGVEHAHKKDIAHRDLKPANVLLKNTPGGLVPKVTDFGLAKQLMTRRDIDSTRHGVAMGTPSYMAPEQIRDAGAVDERADMFSLGCILYELFTRRRAFPGEEVLPIYNAVTRGDYIPASQLITDIPERVESAIRGCLQVNRDQRIPDCETLRRVLSGEEQWVIMADEDDEGPDVTEEIPYAEPPVLSHDAPALTLAPSEPWEEEDYQAMAQQASPFDPPPLTRDASEVYLSREHEPAASMGFWGWVGWATFGFALMGVAGALLLWGVRGFEPVQPPPEPPPTVETPADVTPPAPVQPAVDQQEPVAPIAPTEPSPEPTAEEPTVRPAPASDAALAPPAVRPTPKPSAPTPAAATMTVKLLSSPPTATVTINGKVEGRTPLKLELEEGLYSVILESGVERAPFGVEVRPGTDNKWCYVFESRELREGSCR